MEDKILAKPHTLLIDNRNTLTITGVTDTQNFDEENLIVETTLGKISVRGENLQVTKLSLDSGEMSVEGKIISVSYSDIVPRASGFFGRVFG